MTQASSQADAVAPEALLPELLQAHPETREAEQACASPIEGPPARIEPGHRVAHVLAWFPETEVVFLNHGLTAVRSPVLRRTLARQVSLAQVASMRGIAIEPLLRDLNKTAGIGDES